MSRSVSPPSSVTNTSPCWKGFIVPGSTLMYGSSFCMVTRSPRAFNSRPSEEAVRPFPRLDATPPVTKMCFTTSGEGSSRHARIRGRSATRVWTVTEATTTVESTADTDRSARVDLLWLSLAAVVLRLPAVLSSRHLSFDDGVYGATAVAMRHGARPYRDVCSSQGPLHHPLLYVADLVGGRTQDAPRILSLVAAVVITIAVYVIARRIAGRRAGVIAAALATTSGSLFLVTTGISGDGPAIAFAASAVAAAFAYRDRPSTARAVGVGLLVGAACSVKLLAAPVVVPVALVMLVPRRTRDLVTGA